MSSMSQCHKELVDGEGCCSVPMWRNGLPSGFCDKPAFGERPDSKEFLTYDGARIRADGKYSGYIPGLACSAHGGPKGNENE